MLRFGSYRALFFATLLRSGGETTPVVPGVAIQTEAADDVLTETDETIETES